MIQRPRSSSKPTTNTLIDFHALRDPVPLSNLSPRSLSEKLRESTDLSKINFKFLLFEIRVQAKADQAVISTLPTNNSQECHPLCVLFQLQKALATPNDTNTKLLNSNNTMSVEAAPELFIATPEITSHLPLHVLAINTEWSLNSHLDLYFKTVRQVFCEQEQEFFSEQNSSYDFEVMATQIHELLSDRLEKALLKLATRESKAISKSLLTSKGSNHIPVEMDHDEITKLNKELNTNDFTKNVLFSTPTPYNDFHTESVLHLHIPIPQNWESMNDLSTTLVKLKPTSNEYKFVKSLMDTTIQKHKGNVGGEFSQYLIRSIARIQNAKLYVKYFLKSQEYAHEKKQLELYLFHGCPEAVVDTIVEKGFDPRKSKFDGMFGLGIYLADLSSKSNQYSKCQQHESTSCKVCEKKLFLCRALIGDPYFTKVAMRYAKEPPINKDSVIALSRKDVPDSAVEYREYIFYDKDVVYPEYVISYQLK